MIGVILMVAITVILAAVIGAFVLDLGSGVEENAQAGANINIDETNQQVSVTYSTSQNADYIEAELTSSGTSPAVAALCSPGAKVTWSESSSSTSGSVIDDGSNCDSGGTDYSDSSAVINGEDVDVVVTAVAGDTSTVIAEDSGSIPS